MTGSIHPPQTPGSFSGLLRQVRKRIATSARPALIHLGASAAIALLAMAVVFLIWYPGVMAEAQAVSRLVLILIGVDVVIGPLITLIIFDPKKSWLPLDLMVIAAFQTIALLYGLQAIHGGRPAYVVFSVDRFEVIPVQDLNAGSLSRVPEGMGLSHFGPRWVAAQLPQDPEKRNEVMFSAIGGGADLSQLPEYFAALEAERDNMIRRQRPLEELRKINELSEEEWAAFVDGFGKAEQDLGYLPMSANAKDGAVIIDRASGEILDTVMLTPRFGGSGNKAPARALPNAG